MNGIRSRTPPHVVEAFRSFLSDIHTKVAPPTGFSKENLKVFSVPSSYGPDFLYSLVIEFYYETRLLVQVTLSHVSTPFKDSINLRTDTFYIQRGAVPNKNVSYVLTEKTYDSSLCKAARLINSMFEQAYRRYLDELNQKGQLSELVTTYKNWEQLYKPNNVFFYCDDTSYTSTIVIEYKEAQKYNPCLPSTTLSFHITNVEQLQALLDWLLDAKLV